MCGIVGLFAKNSEMRPRLGALLAPMLIGMSERGPDSAGVAVYRGEGEKGTVRITLFHPLSGYDWTGLAEALGRDFAVAVDAEVKGTHAVIRLKGDSTAPTRRWIADHHPDVRVFGYGEVMEVYKDRGLPAEVIARYGLADMEGTHGIGHTRMATESAVTTEHSHPFAAAADMCLVHNGSLSNHNRLRRWLRRHGQEFDTDNDTEVAARYFAHRLGEGASLDEAMEAGLKDLDGFYTFAMGTRTGFAVLRDPIACKPAVLAENDDWVAMASEFRSLAGLPGIEHAHVWEPKPAVVYTWSVGKNA